MGLDMYLHAKGHFSGFEFMNDEAQQAQFRALVDLLDVSAYVEPNSPMIGITLTVAYWRKANAIHNWFVENVQGGKDECEPHHVTREQLQELLALCKTILAPKEGGIKKTLAKGELPTRSGFFFGDTDYGEWYVRALKDTVTMLERALTLPDDDHYWSFEYQSSW